MSNIFDQGSNVLARGVGLDTLKGGVADFVRKTSLFPAGKPPKRPTLRKPPKRPTFHSQYLQDFSKEWVVLGVPQSGSFWGFPRRKQRGFR